MKKHYKVNPNTIKILNEFYKNIKVENERLNSWLFPTLNNHINNFDYKIDILDFGCGMGKDLNHIYQNFKNVVNKAVGIDFSDVAINKGKEFYKDLDLRIGKSVDDNEKFDLIYCSQTLEHTDNPTEIILNLKSALKNNGVLVLTVPYPNSPLDLLPELHFWQITYEDFENILGKCKQSRIDNILIIEYLNF